ncbi:baseplate assembly protein [Pseudomonas chlororaphis]|uniref:Phage baseplate assembly protein J n=1 Tax=Pseudomonas chlororaphis TaxID=587753 RepID=A0AAX3G5P2_9PSED|nr:baseplate J/gp47 family protein [Pseudomonas chlororaphis]AZC37109.1 Baseplate assembly protein J [Pseudomonas chlororaphis subsp. piscium]AZC43655.1 Baseplate assembly protein J [Pseudomonas chlororaphis subsp. piscium]WDG75519.1 baseplate J/gp47 family protein [Pseudomonas chlororaphis]WDH26845.1 baseplate J/gp47 family protein [Pseudomonas chlororaphis]WDH74039.1 baseplate J/gp47 family protein [Pseudomonas chlororaphis]
MSAVDLSLLPAPQVLESLDFEEIYGEELQRFREYMGDKWDALLESDPITKLLELGAFRRMQNRARVNDAAKSLLLAYATKADLDQLAANVNLQRLVVQAEDLNAVPPVERVLEGDDALRERVQLVYEGLTTAGPRNSYILHARNASGRVADATAESPAPAEVVVTVLDLEGTGLAPPELLETVRLHLSDDDVRPVADRLTVQSAQILTYRVEALVYMSGTGPENEAILAECRQRLQAWVNPRRRLGLEVARSGVDAQLHIAGVSRVELVGWTDIRPTKAQAAWCEDISVTRGG